MVSTETQTTLDGDQNQIVILHVSVLLPNATNMKVVCQQNKIKNETPPKTAVTNNYYMLEIL